MNDPDTPLSKMMRCRDCEIAELVDDYLAYYGWGLFPSGSALRLGRLVFGDMMEWEDTKDHERVIRVPSVVMRTATQILEHPSTNLE